MVNLEPELNFACLAIIAILSRAVAFPGVLIMVNTLAIERDEPNALGQKFIMEYRGIFVDCDQMWGHCGNFCNESSTERVCEADIAVVECKLDSFRTGF